MRWTAFTVTVLLAAASARAESGDGGSPNEATPAATVLIGPPPPPKPEPPPAIGAEPSGSAGPSSELPPPSGSAVAVPSAASGKNKAVAPRGSAEVVPAKNDASVRLGETVVFTFRAPSGGKSPADRARIASKALTAAANDPRGGEVKVVRQGEVAVVYSGSTPIVQLSSADAQAAGDSSLDVHAGAVASSVRQALESERQRSRVAGNVFSLSLVVFFALIALYLMRKVGELAGRLRVWLEHNGARVLAIRVQRIELVTPAVLRSSALIALGLAKWIGQFGIFYAWLVIVLSLFDATRGYTERLTGLVVTPFSQLMTRVATALPLVVVAGIAGLAVLVLVRFVGLFFAGVARRETTLAWLPADLAAPTSVLLRIGIVIAALVFGAPVVTGDADGSLGRAGAIALVALGLASTPLLATGLVGSVVLFGRRLRVGEHVQFAGMLGRISAINLLELRVETVDGAELRIPHFLLLGKPLLGLGRYPRLSVEVTVTSSVSPGKVEPVFEDAAGMVGREVQIQLLNADADGLLYRISAVCDSLDARPRLVSRVLDALSKAQIPLGRARSWKRLE